MAMLPYTWSDTWLLQAATSSLRADLGTVRELASRLSGARFGLITLGRVPGWSGAVAAVHRDQLAAQAKQVQVAIDALGTAATSLAKQIDAQDALVRQQQAALMRQDAAAAAAKAG